MLTKWITAWNKWLIICNRATNKNLNTYDIVWTEQTHAVYSADVSENR